MKNGTNKKQTKMQLDVEVYKQARKEWQQIVQHTQEEVMFFTVITAKRVLRVKAKSIQALTQALHEVGISYLAIEQD